MMLPKEVRHYHGSFLADDLLLREAEHLVDGVRTVLDLAKSALHSGDLDLNIFRMEEGIICEL